MAKRIEEYFSIDDIVDSDRYKGTMIEDNAEEELVLQTKNKLDDLYNNQVSWKKYVLCGTVIGGTYGALFDTIIGMPVVFCSFLGIIGALGGYAFYSLSLGPVKWESELLRRQCLGSIYTQRINAQMQETTARLKSALAEFQVTLTELRETKEILDYSASKLKKEIVEN